MRRIIQAATLLAVIAGMAMAARGAVSCTVNTSGVAFGAYVSISSQDRDTSGTISVTCSGNVGDSVSYSISLAQGGGSFANRQVSTGSVTAGYNLYTDASRTVVWGDGTSGTATVGDSYTLPTSSSTREYTVFGRIPGGQNQAVVGVYMDDVLVTLTY